MIDKDSIRTAIRAGELAAKNGQPNEAPNYETEEEKSAWITGWKFAKAASLCSHRELLLDGHV